MGSQTNQIATETNVEVGYPSYMDITSVSNKCITVKRLLKGLLATGNKPIYNATTGNGYSSSYQIKSYGSSSPTSVILTKRTVDTLFVDNTSKVIVTNANNYGGYPFSTGTAFLAINSIKTITGTVTVTYVKNLSTASDDGVSTASLDFDNPEEDTESNTNGQEPTVAGNMSRVTIPGCTQAPPCTGLDDSCVGNDKPQPCTSQTCAQATCPGKTICSPDSIISDVVDRSYALDISVQLYNGVDSSGNDTYINIDTVTFSRTVTLGTGISDKFTLSIPTGIPFVINGTPTGAFRFKLKGNFAVGFDNTFDKNGYLSATITATMPRIYVAVYNPGPKCIKYDDLSTVYSVYGKSV